MAGIEALRSDNTLDHPVDLSERKGAVATSSVDSPAIGFDRPPVDTRVGLRELIVAAKAEHERFEHAIDAEVITPQIGSEKGPYGEIL